MPTVANKGYKAELESNRRRHREVSVVTESAAARVAAPADEVFRFLDDPARFGEHMGRSDWRTAGMRMHYVLDAERGQAVGSLIRLEGQMLGVKLRVDEVVQLRDPPVRKVWTTLPGARLLVISAYRMGFETERLGTAQCVLHVFMDYEPAKPWLRSIAGMYARWCVNQVVRDATRRFGGQGR